MNRVLFSSQTDSWSTPPDFFAKVVAEFGPFDLDPCATAENAKAPKYYTREQDGLTQPWYGKMWVNPPYGRGKRGAGPWVARAALEAGKDTLEMTKKRIVRRLELAMFGYPGLAQYRPELVAMLLPARTDTAWWHDYVIPYASEIRFLRGRLKFGTSRNSAPFPSALVIFRRGNS